MIQRNGYGSKKGLRWWPKRSGGTVGVHQGVYCSENGCEEPGEASAGRLQPDS